MQSSLFRFWLYLKWSLEFVYAPPFLFITLAIVVSLIVSVLVKGSSAREVWKQHWSIPLVQFLCFPATIAIAAIGYVDWQPPNYHGPNSWGLRAEDLLGVISLGLGAYWIWKMKGMRWIALSVTLLQLWLLAGANFIAGMALTGRWL